MYTDDSLASNPAASDLIYNVLEILKDEVAMEKFKRDNLFCNQKRFRGRTIVWLNEYNKEVISLLNDYFKNYASRIAKNDFLQMLRKN